MRIAPFVLGPSRCESWRSVPQRLKPCRDESVSAGTGVPRGYTASCAQTHEGKGVAAFRACGNGA